MDGGHFQLAYLEVIGGRPIFSSRRLMTDNDGLKPLTLFKNFKIERDLTLHNKM